MGAAFARQGFKPLVLEQHTKPGGYATTFTRNDFTFDVSLHSTTIGERNGIPNLIPGFPEISDVEFVSPPHLYRVIYPEHDIRVPQKNLPQYIGILKELFPKEAEGIDGIFGDMQGVASDVGKISSAKGQIDMSTFPVEYTYLYKTYGATWGNMVDARIRNPKLKTIISSLWPYFGLRLNCARQRGPDIIHLADGAAIILRERNFTMRSKLNALTGTMLVLLICLSTTPGLARAGQAPLKLSIAFTGDSQIGLDPWLETKDQNPSSANIPQLRQTLMDITNQPIRPRLFFFLGDMVVGLLPDEGHAMSLQLEGWQQYYRSFSHPQGMQLLPIAGNHETDVFNFQTFASEPYAYAYDVWLAWIARYGYDHCAGNGPKHGGSNPDKLVRDESNMTFSFNLKGIHFVVINTDTLSTEIDPSTHLPYTGWIPINWVERDLAAAKKNRGISAIIVIGHRFIEAPAYDNSPEETGILNDAAHPFASRLSADLRGNKKVKVYLCCHAHSWEAFRLQHGRGVWQIIAGNAGAPLDSSWQPAGGVYYGYSILDIYASGRMVVRGFGRALPPPPQEFYEGEPVVPKPARLKERIVISNNW